MPITFQSPIRRLSQQEFGDLSFEVMRHVFAIHNEIGRFFDERIYKRELASRMPSVRLEEPIDVTFGSFQKRYFIDVLVGEGGIFEFKAVQSLSGPHRAQLLNYLILCDVAHGKSINVRPNDVEHEYVNANLRRTDRFRFNVESTRWNMSVPGAPQLHEVAVAVLRDLGTGLEIALYEEAIAHTLGGIAKTEADVKVEIDGRQAGVQRVRLIADGVALKITAFDGPLDQFEIHACRLLSNIDLRAIAWLNINTNKVTFTVLER